MEDITKTESGLFEVHTDRSEHKVSGDFSHNMSIILLF